MKANGQKATESLRRLFNEADYPIDVRRKFRLEWRILTMEVPGSSALLTPELYEREKYKFNLLTEETRELATLALRQQFAGVVNHMLERLSGDENGRPKRFQSAMLENIGEFLDSFADRNLFADDKLAKLVDQASDTVDRLSTDELLRDGNLRPYIDNEMNALQVALHRALENFPEGRDG